jgi:hypothetical protein
MTGGFFRFHVVPSKRVLESGDVTACTGLVKLDVMTVFMIAKVDTNTMIAKVDTNRRTLFDLRHAPELGETIEKTVSVLRRSVGEVSRKAEELGRIHRGA